MVGNVSTIECTAFYEYPKAFAARSAALILQHNAKLDWASDTTGYFARYSWNRLRICVRCVVVWLTCVFFSILANANATPLGKMCFKVR